MRLLFVPLINLLLLLRALLGLPFRLLGTRPTVVHFRLSGDPPYRELPGQRRWSLLGGQGRPEPATVTSLEAFKKALELLARDPQVKGILLELEALAIPAAKREALAQLLADFRAAGKRVVAWAVSVDNLGYQMMCAADELWLSPAGRVELIGFAAEASALGQGLGQLGIQPHFVRRGAYKTAPELFTHPEISDIQRQTLESFLDERYTELVDTLARGRQRTPEQVRAWIDAGPYSAQRALAAGLVDGLCDEVDLPARLEAQGTPAQASKKDAAPETKTDTTSEPKKDADKAAEDPESELSPMPAYLARLTWPQVRWRRLRSLPKLGVVPVSGMIVPGQGGAGVGPEFAGSQSVVKALRAAARERRIKAVLLYVSSTGGSAVASEIILEAVQRVARKKPVIAFTDRVSASGGYMVMLGAKEIWSTPHAIVGSIGVFAGKFDVSGLLHTLGVNRTLLTRGAHAGIFSTTRGFTDEERAVMEAEVEETYQAFLGHVARARGRTREEIHALGEGRVYSGLRAHAAGLVDRLEGFEAACQRAMELAQVPGRFELQIYGGGQRRMSLLRLLLSYSRAATYAFCPTAWDLGGFGGGERFE